MRVLVACEFSGVVRRAFRARGHDAYSADLLLSEDDDRQHHLDGDVIPWLLRKNRWDLLIAHPPCTRLTNAGVRWLYLGGRGTVRDPEKWHELKDAAAFFSRFWSGHDIPKVAIENPIMHEHATALIDAGEPTQIIQPWQFGHKEMKATCLWLRGLPPLAPTHVVGPPPKDPAERRKWAKCHQASPGPNRWKVRSRTYEGIAAAMADQWGDY